MLAAADPINALSQRDVAVSLVALAKFPNSGILWQDVATQWDSMAAQGILAPADQQFRDYAHKQAE